MADITRSVYPRLRHLRGSATTHVIHRRNGRIVRQGTAASFFFDPLLAVISEVPVDDRELPLLFHARTADHQDVSVQAGVTYRVVDPAVASKRVDFSIDPGTGRWRGTPLDTLAGLMSETAQQAALDVLVSLPLLDALTGGVRRVREAMAGVLASERRLPGTGLEMRDVRVVAIRAEAEVERALANPTREQVKQLADRATYERRALAVEAERTISENELQSRIELAVREERLVAQEGANQRRRAEEEAAAGAIAATAAANESGIRAGADAAAARLLGDAAGAAEAARISAYAGADRAVAVTLALKDFHGELPSIGSITVTPDLLADALAALAGGRPPVR